MLLLLRAHEEGIPNPHPYRWRAPSAVLSRERRRGSSRYYGMERRGKRRVCADSEHFSLAVVAVFRDLGHTRAAGGWQVISTVTSPPSAKVGSRINPFFSSFFPTSVSFSDKEERRGESASFLRSGEEEEEEEQVPAFPAKAGEEWKKLQMSTDGPRVDGVQKMPLFLVRENKKEVGRRGRWPGKLLLLLPLPPFSSVLAQKRGGGREKGGLLLFLPPFLFLE